MYYHQTRQSELNQRLEDEKEKKRRTIQGNPNTKQSIYNCMRRDENTGTSKPSHYDRKKLIIHMDLIICMTAMEKTEVKSCGGPAWKWNNPFVQNMQ